VAVVPVFFLLAGPNGAGKSTLYKALLARGTIPAEAEFINADLYESAHLQHIRDLTERSEAAREWADERRAHCVAQGISFVSETVFSHESKLQLIDDARAAGFFVTLLVVAIDNPQRLLERVQQRVREGGHDVPAERILARYPRTLSNLTLAVRRADVAFLYDAEDIEPGTHRMVAWCRQEQTSIQVKTLPRWAVQVIGLPAV
jgi:predicted ABC-type ATPase